MKVFQDGDNEVVEVVLRMQKRNFDALVKAEEANEYVPVHGISIGYDEAASVPIARLHVNSPESLKEDQKAMGFYGVTITRS